MSEWRIPASQLPIPKETLRATFAGMAMQGMLASGDERYMFKIAKDAVKAADALIEELNK